MSKTILIIGTYDTKDDELNFVADCIQEQGGDVLTMDVSVLGDPSMPTDISKHDVAEAGNSSIQAAIDSGDENTAMQIMAKGASILCAQLHSERKIDGMIALGGTMGTDLALDCAQALPMGVPKYVVSTVSFSPLIPADRLSPDARQGYFAAVMDFALPELSNLMVGSVINAGADRLTNAGKQGIPQIVSPGCADLIDFAGWQEIPEAYSDRPFHAHNRLIKSSGLSPEERRALVRDIAHRLSTATAPVHVLMPTQGVEEWDREGEPAHDPEGLSAMVDEMSQAIKAPIELTTLDSHINDQAFATAALSVLDEWISTGVVKMN